MAKNIRVYGIILLLLGSVYCSGQSDNVRSAVIDTALSQVGVREATGHNDGKAVEKYLKTCGIGKGNAWCAAFLTWNFQVNKVVTIKSAWAPNWFPLSNTIYIRSKFIKDQPQAGDVFGLWINNRIGHVGFIYKWSDKITTTIEGNTNEAGSREGDGVYIKKRLTKQIYAVSKWVK